MRAAAALFAALAVGQPSPARLTPAAPVAELAAPASAEVLRLEVRAIDNPARAPVTILVETRDGERLGAFSLVPADEPAAFALRAPAAGGPLTVRLLLEPGRGAPAHLDIALVSAR
ncbi:hypothetical protein [Thermaurantiacus sp.]